jgi:hypothetical protein
MGSKDNRILVLDFGSQYTQLIARRVRENEVYSEILPWDIGEDRIKECNPKGIIPNLLLLAYLRFVLIWKYLYWVYVTECKL